MVSNDLSVCNNNRKIMEEYGIMEYLELTVTRCGRWTGNREFIWSGLISSTAYKAFVVVAILV